MRIMIYDTETTGLPPKKTDLTFETLDMFPHIVQFSYIIYDTEMEEIVEVRDHIIKMEKDIVIPEESIKFHKITQYISLTKGVDIRSVLNKFCYRLRSIDLLIAHNYSFDVQMVKAELMRSIKDKSTCLTQKKVSTENLQFIENMSSYCTLRATINHCKLSTVGKYGNIYYKFPKLIELHDNLFHYVPDPEKMHNSLIDVIVTLRCYMKFKHDIDMKEGRCKTFKKLSSECL